MGFDLDSQSAFGDADGLRNFLLVHSRAHMTFARAILTTYAQTTPATILYDTGALEDWIACMTDENAQVTPRIRTWLLSHRALHDAETQVTGVSQGFDLEDVDLKDKQQFDDWMQNHQALHDATAAKLGVTI